MLRTGKLLVNTGIFLKFPSVPYICRILLMSFESCFVHKTMVKTCGRVVSSLVLALHWMESGALGGGCRFTLSYLIQLVGLNSGLRCVRMVLVGTVTIVAEIGVGFKKVVDVMEMANSLKAKAILATQPIKQ